MSRLRLPLMIAVAAGLAVMRWWVPPQDETAGGVELVAAVQTQPRLMAQVSEVTSLSPSSAMSGVDLPGNAFAVRVPPVPPAPPPPPPPPKVKLFVGPPEPPPYVPPPPPPAPPLQVVGTWDDGRAPGVFVASPQGGTVLARVGTVLLAEYKVTGLTPQHVAVTHTASKHEWRLPIPRAGSHP